MDFSKCPYCGGELTDLNIELSESEQLDIDFIVALEMNANTALKPEVVNRLKLSDDQIFSYFSAVFDQKAKSHFLMNSFKKEIRKKNNIDPETDILVLNGRVYSHGNL